ncbi:hypothetical protein HDV00_010153 [Rhizophlyctis rosea]|nr:hypothetical protein HDV00_010153 [Rhizophlyctis rosea]
MARVEGVGFVKEVVACINWNIINGLIKVVLGYEDAEALLRKIAACDVNEGGVAEVYYPFSDDFPLLASILCDSDIIHQSLHLTTEALIRSLPQTLRETSSIHPAILVYNLQTGNADPRFQCRHLTDKECLHPRYTTPPGAPSLDMTNIGGVSVVPTLAQFRRALKVFSIDVLSKAPLKDLMAVVAGGAITTCLMPWPRNIQDHYHLEIAAHKVIYKLGNLPIEITQHIESYTRILEAYTHTTDRALFRWLHSKKSPFTSSDIDIFFLTSATASNVAEPIQNLPKMHQHIIQARNQMDVKLMRPDRDTDRTWAGNMQWMGVRTQEVLDMGWGDTYLQAWLATHEGLDAAQIDERKRQLASTFEAERNGVRRPSKWSDMFKWAIKGRIAALPTIRTSNSVSVVGLWPVRQTQMILPVTRSGEELVESFDLDCVAVWWDGENVYASSRALRAFNTRTNFVNLSCISTRNTRKRITKYAARGFTPLYFEPCSCTHTSPPIHRHDVAPPSSTRALLDSFKSASALFEDAENTDTAQPPDAIDILHRAYRYTNGEYPYGPRITIEDMRPGVEEMLVGDRCKDRYPSCQSMLFLFKPTDTAGQDVSNSVLAADYSVLLGDSGQFEQYVREDLVKWVGNWCLSAIAGPCRGTDAVVWRRWQGMKFMWEWDQCREARKKILDAVRNCYVCEVPLNVLDDGWSWSSEEKRLVQARSREGRVGWRALEHESMDMDEIPTGYLIRPTDPEAFARHDLDPEPPTPPAEEQPHPNRRRICPTLRLCALCKSVNKEKVAETIWRPIRDQAFKDARCIVTGAENGVTFLLAVTLLQSGGHVLVTSEVPYLTARRLKVLLDSEQWGRVKIYKMCYADEKGEHDFIEWVGGCERKRADAIFVSALEGLDEEERRRCRSGERRLSGDVSRMELESTMCAAEASRREAEPADDDTRDPNISLRPQIFSRTYMTPTSLLTQLTAIMAQTEEPRTKSARPVISIIVPCQDNDKYCIASSEESDTTHKAACQALETFLEGFRASGDVVVRAVNPGWVRVRPAVAFATIEGSGIGNTVEAEVDGDVITPVLKEEDAVARVLDGVVWAMDGKCEAKFSGKIVKHFVEA